MPALAEPEVQDEEVPIKPKMVKKMAYFNRLQAAFDEYDQAFLVNADNVGSKQMQEIRLKTRGDWYVANSSHIDPVVSSAQRLRHWIVLFFFTSCFALL